MTDYREAARQAVRDHEGTATYEELTEGFKLTAVKAGVVVRTLLEEGVLVEGPRMHYREGSGGRQDPKTQLIIDALGARDNVATFEVLAEATELSWNKLGEALRSLLVDGRIVEGPPMVYSIGGDEQVPEGERLRKLGLERTVRTESVLNGICPYRGGVWCKLDDRCPEYLDTAVVLAKVSDEMVAGPVPYLREGTDCWDCVHGHKREGEAGMAVQAKREGSLRKRRRAS